MRLSALRSTAAAIIVLGPIAAAAWMIHGPQWSRTGFVEVDRTTIAGPAAERVRAYLAGRDPILDRLLPDGAGGTRFFEDLGGNAGMAFIGVSAVGLSAAADGGGWPESTELHERAHLLYAFLPQEVSRLMARLGAPASGEYAATNSSEHFAEMAGTAWEIVVPPDAMCMEGTPAARLDDAERRVPGTAGFVSWYLRQMRREGVADDEGLVRTAASLTASYRAESEALWKAVEERRLPGGEFRAWEPPSVRTYLEGMRADSLLSRSWIERTTGHLLVPSLIVLSIAGR